MLSLLLRIFLFLFIPVCILAQKPSSISAVCGKPTSPDRLSGRCEVFVSRSGDNGGVYHSWQLLGSSGWQSPWIMYTPAPDDNVHGLVSGVDGQGRIAVAWISKGAIYVAAARQKDVSLTTPTAATFSPQQTADGSTAKFNFLAMSTDKNGAIVLVALDEKGRAWTYEEVMQFDATALNWAWNPIAETGGDIKNISLTTFGSDNRLGMVATGGNGKVYMTQQASPGNPWDSWINLEGHDIREVHAQSSSAGQFEIIALGSDKNLYLRYQNVGNATWSGWESLNTQSANIEIKPLTIFGKHADGSLFVVTQATLKGFNTYTGFLELIQSANNGGWFKDLRRYAGPENTIYGPLGLFDPDLLAVTADAKGVIHYFGVIEQTSALLEHYIETGVNSSGQTKLSYEHVAHMMPALPWK